MAAFRLVVVFTLFWGAVLTTVEHQCLHHELVEEFMRRPNHVLVTRPQNYEPDNETDSMQKRANEAGSSWGSIRITYSNGLLNADNDRDRMCRQAGDTVWLGPWPDPGGDTTYPCDSDTTTSCRYTCKSTDILTPLYRNFIQTILEDAIQYLQYALQVKRVAGNLTVAEIIGQGGSCGANNLTVPEQYQTLGLPDSDIHLFVTARPIVGTTIAQAIACQFDNKYRSTAGHINFNPSKLSLEYKDQQQQTRVAIHETCHVLGFTSLVFFPGQSGVSADRTMMIDPDTEEHLLADTVTRVTVASQGQPYNVTKIITPAVVDAARRHFGCPDLDGVELENGGARGTYMQHWEKRILLNEFLTGTASPNAIISNMTLAMLHDTGWYRANFDRAEHLDWGYQRGCKFVNASCGLWSERDGSCTSALADACTYDQVAKGQCGLRTYSKPLPPQYQNFPGQPNKGGSAELSDYCPFVVGYADGDCRYPPSSSSSVDYQGQMFCEECRCFTGNVRNPDNAQQTQITSACYQRVCIGTDFMKVKVGSRVFYDCKALGQKIKVFADSYEGHIVCPDVKRLCSGASNDTSWPVYSGIKPSKGGVGDTVYIYGRNLVAGMLVEINGYALEDVKLFLKAQDPYNYSNPSLPAATHFLTGKLPNYKNVDVDDVSDIMIMDPNSKKTAVFYSVFTMYVPESVYHQLWNNYQSAMIAVIAVISVIVIAAIIISWVLKRINKAKQVRPVMTKTEQFNDEARRMFKYYDKDNSGYLDQTEFKRVMRDVARLLEFREPTERDYREALELVDADGNHKITFEELARWWRHFQGQS
eukprot:TRINITY_DN9296_c1_g1_i1.p1 TRINITY_DN9296_c1_g1~~TRINITY_DN9296_c1_g1_i1.p1  ORF type:complete len:815 (-),score=340.57 TRINITY_DN9296_c1_g1_i1:196-2640(-)